MTMEKTLLIIKAVSDGNRVRVLMALTHENEMCACHIAQLLQISPPTVSRHMGIMLAAGIVTARKDSRWVYYRLADETREPHIRPLIEWLVSSLKTDPVIVQDQAFLESIICSGKAQMMCR